MLLEPGTINAFKLVLTDPQKYEVDIRPLKDCLRESKEVTAKHKLADSILKEYRYAVPKVFLYIIMDQIYGHCEHKDAKGDLGYHLEYVPIGAEEIKS